MTGSDTHREAIEAMDGRMRRFDRLTEWPTTQEGFGLLLDAIPAAVLARLAVERGGLELCGYVDHSLEPLVFGAPGELVTEVEQLHDGDQPVYRIVEAGDE